MRCTTQSPEFCAADEPRNLVLLYVTYVCETAVRVILDAWPVLKGTQSSIRDRRAEEEFTMTKVYIVYKSNGDGLVDMLPPEDISLPDVPFSVKTITFFWLSALLLQAIRVNSSNLLMDGDVGLINGFR